MSQEWYLLKSPHNQISGYEDEALNDFCEEGFLEALQTNLAKTVELFNCDLSQSKRIRAIVQNNIQDTKLKTLSRQVLLPIGTCKSGMYIKYKNRYWIIIGLVDDNTMYEKAIVMLCNHLLTWINSNGEIIQRWVNIRSASQYNNGETNIDKYRIRSDQLMIIAPDDDECLLLDTGKRFVIDKRCKVYEKKIAPDTVKDTSKDLAIYRLTRTDSVLYDYQDSGHYEFMATQDEQHETDGYYVIKDKGYWLCEEPTFFNESNSMTCVIECSSYEIYNGLDPSIFTAKFYDESGSEIEISPNWEICCDFTNKLDVSYIDNSILISVDNSDLVNRSFILFLSGDGYKPVSVTIFIKAFF